MHVLSLSETYRYTIVFRLWFSPSGRRLIVLAGHSGGPNRLWNWDVPNRKAIGHRTVITDKQHENCFPFPVFDRTLRYLAYDGRVIDRKTRRQVKLWGAFDAPIALTPNGRSVFANARDWQIERYNLGWKFDGNRIEIKPEDSQTLTQRGQEYVENLIVSPSGDLLVVLTSDGDKLLPFRLADGTALPEMELPVFETDGVRMSMEPYGRMAFSPDGKIVAVAGDGVVLADPLGGQPVRVLDERYFGDIAFTPDGERLIGVRQDGTVVEWNVSSGSAARTYNFQEEGGELRAVAVAPDGLMAVAGGSDGELVWWDL